MIKGIKQWLNGLTAKVKEYNKRRKNRQVRDDIQLMEHDGQIFISYRGIPIFAVGEYYDNTDMLDILNNCREHYKNYLTEQNFGA